MIEKHNNLEPFHTTTDFWECDCGQGFYHSTLEHECQVCHATSDESPDARVEEMLEKINTLESPTIVNTRTETVWVVRSVNGSFLVKESVGTALFLRITNVQDHLLVAHFATEKLARQEALARLKTRTMFDVVPIMMVGKRIKP